MWNPTSSSTASLTDNKVNVKEIDEGSIGECSEAAEQLHQQEKTNSKQMPTFGTQSKNIQQNYREFGLEEGDKGKQFLDLAEETTDSGFISGPQTSSSANLDIDHEESGDKKLLNTSAPLQEPNFDSVIIEEDLEEDQETNDSNMRLPHSVEAGISERFCNLSLASNSNTNPSISVTGSGLNNLDTPKQNSVQQGKPEVLTLPAVSSAQQHQQNTTVPQQITPANAWEKFYQQNDEGDTPLHLACISGYEDVVAALIRMAPHPCLFNIQNDVAQTPLHLATLTAQPKIIRMLLIAGAKPTVRDRHGNTALHLACISGEEQCVRALTIPISASEINEAQRQYGHRANDKSYLKYAQLPSDLEIRNYDGERCVHLAAQAGFINILRILVLYGADINAREGKAGRTPLHIAIENCNEELANYLLDDCQKLNLETSTYAGLTAYQVACMLNKSRMLNILEKGGAEPLTPPDSDYDSSDIETDYNDSKLYDRFGDPGYFVGYKGANAMTVA